MNPEEDHSDPPTRSEAKTIVTIGPGHKLGKYLVKRILGRGGMGAVYLARDTELDRDIALKVISMPLSQDPESREAISRFQREAKTAASLSHPGIVRVYEAGSLNDIHFIAMEYIKGSTLESILEREEQPPMRRLVDMVAQVARAVHFAHSQGIIHRDIKPANIFIDTENKVYIGDFGIARNLSSGTLTHTGVVVGTPSYMAPEQAQGVRDLDARCDVYALGALLYHVLTGSPPFVGPPSMELLRKIVQQDPITPRRFNPNVSKALEAICLKAITKERNHRYPDADSLAEDLRRWSDGEPISARRISVIRRFYLKLKRRPVVSTSVTVAVLALAIGGSFLTYGLKTKSRVTRLDEARRNAEGLVAQARGELDAAESFIESGKERPQAVDERIERARNLLHQAGVSDDSYAPIYLEQARIGELTREWKNAIDVLSAGLEKRPDHLPMLVMRARIALEATSLHVDPIRVWQKMPQSPRKGMWRMNEVYEGSDDYRKMAIADLRRISELDPNRSEGKLAEAILRMLEDEMEQAVELFSAALAEDPSNGLAYGGRGFCRVVLDRWEEASSDLDAAVQREPRSACWRLNRSRVSFALRKFDKAILDCNRLLAVDFRRPSVLSWRGYVREIKGDLEGALQDYREVLALLPDDEEFRITFAEFLIQVKRDSEAEDVLAAVSDSKSTAYAFVKGNLAKFNGDLDAALRWYSHGLKDHPDDGELLIQRGIIYAQTKKYAQARSDFNRALKLEEADHSRAALNLGVTFAEQGNDQEGMRHFDMAIRLRPDYESAYVNRGVSHERLGDSDNALADYQTAIRLNPESSAMHSLKFLWRDTGKSAYGIKFLSEQMLKHPSSANLREARGSLYNWKGNHEMALLDVRQLISEHPNDPRGYSLRGDIHLDHREYRKAVADLKRALDMKPGNRYVMTRLAEAYLGLEEWEKTKIVLEEILRKDPGHAPAWKYLADVHSAQKDHQSAIDAYTRAMKFRPSMERHIIMSRGIAYARLGKVKEAEADFKRAASLNPQEPKVFGNLGSFMANTGRPREAIAWYARAVRLDPGYARAWKDKGFAHVALDQKAEAVFCWEEAIRQDPRLKEALEPFIEKNKKDF